MRHFLSFLSTFYFINFSFSQTLSPEAISTAGSSFNNGSNGLNWTLGEPVTSTLNTTSNILTQGFHQDKFTITSVEDENGDSGITIFPNPTIDAIMVQLKFPDKSTSMELYTVEGKLLSSRSIHSETSFQVDMSNYASGTYVLKIKNKNLKSYQIVKLK